MKRIILFNFLLLFICSCGSEAEDGMVISESQRLSSELDSVIEKAGGKNSFILPESNDFKNIPQDPNNKLNQYKVELGKNLFHETAIALAPKNNSLKFTYSCASCHSVDAGFSSGNKQGIGEGGLGDGANRFINPLVNEADVDIQHVKSLTILNVAYQLNTLWNGQFGATGHNIGLEDKFTEGTPKEVNNLGFEGVESQAIAALKVHRQVTDDSVLENSWVANNYEYMELFKKSFSSSENKEMTKKSIGLAIAAFERTVIANRAPFQRYLRGDVNALSIKSKKGAILFFGKARCTECHNGPSLSDNNFHSIGLSDLDTNSDVIILNQDFPEKLGRASFTGNPEDDFKFKTPQLYNLKDHASFGHGSSFGSIKDVIIYKNKIKIQNSNLNFLDLSIFQQKLYLTEEEIDNLVYFISNGLYDDNLERYVPTKTISELPFPNNDSAISND